ncbi:GNAT family N-acetyltransferase [Kangiella sp. HZ709]|uniref:GNAT family N-acetyltransferase n=1 Tax=Kangiella sp. HZ709 TaxID=2666328 RepID=UPI0012B0F803|nr:GNAT family N-acetyltransferase [Kangiella sp. HZ709]MRX27859.1 GNAT family N-acetyltransferase [Kangiella sp. HZ709]
MKIIEDDLQSKEIQQFLSAHMDDMKRVSPPESIHALDITELLKDDMSFWSLWFENQLAGCIALKELDSKHGEIKSMRTARCFRKKGVATELLTFLIEEAKARRYSLLSLETGAMDYFKPARLLYRKFGFANCQPFANYKLDPHSVFMNKKLDKYE